MCRDRYSNIKPDGNSRDHFRRACHGAVVLLTLVFLCDAHPIKSQGRDIFGSQALIKQLKKKYRLTSADVTSLTPLIRKENREVIILYSRYSGDEPEYSHRVWYQIIERRRDVESTAANAARKRRKLAFAAARTALERRMLAILVEDYVDFLARFLDLSDWQFDEVIEIFETDRKRKEAAITKHLANSEVLFDELAAATRETERRLEKILLAEQLKDYRLILFQGTPIIG